MRARTPHRCPRTSFRHPRQRLTIESLEARRLMAADIRDTHSASPLPLAVDIRSVTPLDFTYTDADIVRFTVQFAEPVQDIDAADFAPRVFDSISHARILNVVGTGTQYVVSVGTGTGDGLVFLSLAQDYAISAGNDQLVSLTWPGGQGYVIDRTDGRSQIDNTPKGNDGITLYDDPTSSISGFKYNDLNGNGSRDAGEPGLSGWTIYLDSNANGALDGAEPSVLTGADGSYTFSNLVPGKYLVGEVMQPGWEQTAPGAATFPIRRVSVTSTGAEGAGISDRPAVSADGRFVAFESTSILTPGDTTVSDIFVFDRVTNTLEKISKGTNGAVANGSSFEPSISNDGRMVVFTSNASNLVNSGEGNAQPDVYVYDRQTQITQLVSTSQFGIGNAASSSGDVSGDGRYVVYQSNASNLVSNDTNSLADIFVVDLQDQNYFTRTQLVSKGLVGAPANGSSARPRISDDGSQIVYESSATNLVANDTFINDIYVTSRVTQLTRRVSQTAAGTEANSFSQGANISGDGRYVAFWTNASNLAGDDTNGTPDVYLVDLSLNTIEAVSRTSAGALIGQSSARPAISADGRYVAFGTTNSQFAVNGFDGVLLRDRAGGTTRRLSQSTVGTVAVGASYYFDLSGDGQTAVLGSDGKHLIEGDNNHFRDVFAVDTSFIWVPNTRPVTLGSNQALTNVLIGNQTLAADLQGVAWLDNSRNGLRDPGEPAIADRRVYLDSNSNNQFDTSEASQLTDANGSYRFVGLAAGTYRVREVLPPNWTEYYPGSGHLVTAGSQRTVTLNFDDQPVAAVFIGVYERDGFVLSSTHSSASQWLVTNYSGNFNNALAAAADAPQYLTRRDGRAFNVTSLDMALQLPVSVTLLGIKQDGTQVSQTFSISQNLITYNLTGFTNLKSLHWSGTPRSNIVLDNFVLQTLDWDYNQIDFGSLANYGEIGGIAYLDMDHDGVRSVSEPVLAGRTVYLDTNNNGLRDTTEPLATTDAAGLYRLSNLSPGNYIVRQQLPINWSQSEPGAGAAQLINITPGLFLSDVGFGSWPQGGGIAGTKFEDRNFNGMREIDEPALAGWTIYLDSNNNGVLDSGEPSTVTASDDLGTTSIDETGRYAFTGLLPSSYTVREVPRVNWRQTSPLPMPSVSIERSTATGNTNPVFENSPVYDESLNGTGRYLVFTTALALVGSDTNGLGDVYFLDRQTDVFERVSLSTTGGNANGNSYEPTISDDGRYVAFRSVASNLTANGTGGTSNIYLRDRTLGTTQMISMGATAAPNGSSWEPMLSGDGATLSFYTSASNLGLPDTNGVSDLLIKNLTTGALTRADASLASPALTITDTFGADVSANGRYMAFQAVSAGTSQIYWMDRQTGQVQRASTNSVGSVGNLASEKRAISDDGRWVVFDSLATNLTDDSGFVSGAGGYNIFLKDMVTGQTRLVSRNFNGAAANASRRPDISRDGRWIVFESSSQTMFADSANSTTQIVVYDRLTDTLKRLSEASNGIKATGINVNASISADGSAVAFQSTSLNIGPTAIGIFTIDRALNYAQPLAAIAPVTAGVVTGGIDFANEHTTAAISGNAFEDLNRNGVREASEATLAGVTVYIDQNKNGLLDAGELSQVTPATGAYNFNNLPGGATVVRIVTPTDRILTVPQATTNRLFGTFTSGSLLAIAELNPQTGAVVNSFVTTVPSNNAIGMAFDGTNVLVLKPSSQELYKFTPGGQLLETVSLVSILGSAALGSGLAYLDGMVYFLQSRDNWTSLIALDPRTNQLVRAMPITHSLDGYGGAAFPGFGVGLGEAPDGNGLILTAADSPTADVRMLRLDPFSGRVTQYVTPNPSLPSDFGVTSFGGEMYVSVNLNSIRVFNNQFSPARTLTTSTTYTGLGGGLWLDLGHAINLGSGQVVTDRNFGLIASKGSISGHLYEDRNANGQQDSGEADLVGTRVYLDANANRQFDSGEQSVNTNGVGNYTLSDVPAGPTIVRIQPPAGVGVLAPVNPENRLFAALFVNSVGSIVELNPYDGTILQTVNLPVGTVFSGNVGLAYDGQELFFIEAQTRLLLGVNPDTGALLRSVQLTTGSIDGLAYVGGKLYMLDYVSDSILEFDPQSNQVVRTLDINALNPNYLGVGTRIDLGVALGEANDGTRLIVHSLLPLPITYVVNRNTGTIEAQWAQTVTSGLAGTATELYRAQAGATPSLSIVNSQGNVLRRYSTGQLPRGLAAATPASQQLRFNLNRGQIVSGADFTVRDNSVPTDIVMSSSSVLENQATGALVAGLSAVDANPVDSHTFALVAGLGDSDNALFQINGTQLVTRQAFDREQRSNYSVRLRAMDATGNAFEKTFTINITNMPELSAAVQIGDGTAQRSRIDRLVVEIDGAVDIDSGAFQVHKRERDAQGGLLLQPVDTAFVVDNLANGHARITLTFSGIYTRASGGLIDGNYQLTIDAGKIRAAGTTVSLDGNGDGSAGGNYLLGTQEVDSFYALYGDNDGGRSVGVADFGRFRSTFGKSLGDVGYDASFDFDNNNAVGVSDFGQFRSRFGKSLDF